MQRLDSALDPCGAEGFFQPSLPDGVMVAQVTLTHLVMVRIHVGQPCKNRFSSERVFPKPSEMVENGRFLVQLWSSVAKRESSK
jgi:hypothetical protein